MLVIPFSLGLVMPNKVYHPDQGVILVSVLIGALTCKILYEVTALISSRFKCYVKLNRSQKVEWNNRAFSTVHALVVSAVSFYLLWSSNLFKDEKPDDLMINRNSILSNSTLSGSIGYFLADMAMILWQFPALGGKEYLLHHGLSMYSIFLSIISGQAQFYILMVIFSEITTPFVNLRWYLDVSGQKNSKLYVYNGVALFLGWLAARILLFIFFFFHMFLHFDQVKTIFPLGFYSIVSVPPVLALMNLFWFWKILKGLIKTISKGRRVE